MKKWLPDYYDNEENEEFLELVFEYLKPALNDLKTKAERRTFLSETTEKKEKVKTLFEKFEILYANIQLFKKGIQEIESISL